MSLFKSCGAGAIGALLGVIAYLLFQIVYASILLAEPRRQSGGMGVIAVSIGLSSALPAAVAGFVLAFWWHRRRSR